VVAFSLIAIRPPTIQYLQRCVSQGVKEWMPVTAV
jgi:hypothetical protein